MNRDYEQILLLAITCLLGILNFHLYHDITFSYGLIPQEIVVQFLNTLYNW